MIRDDIALARALYERVQTTPELEAFTNSLSITTFRFVPADLQPGNEAVESYLNGLNREMVSRVQTGGEVFLSNAVVEGRYLLRACIVNFRTRLADIEALPAIVTRLGRAVDAEMRPATLTNKASP
jgi:glutamate/tyrosine decarboxylase-like PLP-dependent enzyme